MHNIMPQKTKARRFIDQETGEIVTGQEIYEAISLEEKSQSRFEWLKLYPVLLTALSAVLKSQSFDVIVYLLGKMNYGTNEFICSRSDVVQDTGISRPTVNRVFAGLLQEDLIRPVRGSTWMINPRIIHGGGKIMDTSLAVRFSRLRMNKKAEEKMFSREEDYVSDLMRRVEEMIGDEK